MSVILTTCRSTCFSSRLDLFYFFLPVTVCSGFLTFWCVPFPVPGIIGCLQALEAIKIATSVGEPLSGRMLLFDALSARIRIVC